MIVGGWHRSYQPQAEFSYEPTNCCHSSPDWQSAEGVWLIPNLAARWSRDEAGMTWLETPPLLQYVDWGEQHLNMMVIVTVTNYSWSAIGQELQTPIQESEPFDLAYCAKLIALASKTRH